MNRYSLLVLTLLALVSLRADPLSPAVEVTCHKDWKCEHGNEPGMAEQPLHTLKYIPADGRNAAIMLTVMPNDVPGLTVSDLDSLKRFNRLSAQPFLADRNNPPPVTTLRIPNGIAVAMANEDPALRGKPVPPGEYRIATTVSVLLSRKILIHCTIFYDEKDSKDYQQALEILQSAVLTADTNSRANSI